MSCPAATTCLLYADGELAGSALREMEAHLVGCRDCRSRVVALRDEGALLGEVLRGELHHTAPAAVAVDPRGVALGLPLAVGAVTIALAAAGALLDARLPGAFDLLHPRRIKGAVEMTFDVIFMLRARAPGLVELGFAVGVVASISALGSFVVSAASRRWFGTTVLLALAFAAAPDPARALLVHKGSDYHVSAGERIAESVFTRGADRVDVDGAIDGDLIAMAERVTVRGQINGTLYVFCRELEITGTVGGAVHAISEQVRIEGTVHGGAYALVENLTLTSTARMQGDVGAISEETVVEGSVARDLYVDGDRLDVRGSVGRNLSSHWLKELTLRDGTRVAGNVDVLLPEGRAIERAAGARVDGEVRSGVLPSPREHYLDHYRSWRFYAYHLAWFTAAFLFGLVAHRLGPVIFRGSIANGSQLLRTLVAGFVLLVVMPVAMIAAALTIVGIPIAIAALFLYILALYTADLAAGAWLGGLIVPPADDSLFEFGKSLAAGLAIVTVVSLVPFVGPAAGVVALLLGLGLLSERARAALG
jgi:cytoskeletal protein CcmA (bactofilin family)/anti-sigma factor RsiW